MPFLEVIQQSIPYQADTTSLFARLCENKSNTLLLDSAEIGSKNSLKSLLIAKAAVKVKCEQQTVSFQALTANGEQVIKQLAEQFEAKTGVSVIQQQLALIVTFPTLNNELDEDSKLQAFTVFDGLRTILTLYQQHTQPIFLGGLFAYDLVANFIPMKDIVLEDDGLVSPDYSFYLAEQLVVIDHQAEKAELHSYIFDESQKISISEQAKTIIFQLNEEKDTVLHKQNASTEVAVNIEDEAFKAIIEKLKHHINIGDVFQIVPSRRFSLECPSPLATYQQLKHNNPSPYMFYMQDDDFTLFGASPESALKYTEATRQLEIYPIAGSRPRGFDSQGQIDPELDARLELELRLDHKEQSEHLMLVDLARNDIARVCVSGTRRVAELMQVDRYSHIMHLVSRVVGQLKPELDALHAYQACMNMGTLTGAPKIKAMQLIYQFEKQRRHSYGGAVGYLSSHGDLDTCIVIRSAFVQNGIAYIQAGCGEVLDSNPQMEADETRHKAAAVIKAIKQTNCQ
ncbi:MULTISPECIES: anthranilate synthase component I [Gallibacterium]|uniref:Anthranilate synthase component 1 n=1 Tax=Gallibacterium genomosp. 3 TaxID=505345 RepID=A0A1A7PWR1_9PAST|nr:MULTISPECIES: anthranilate synthase component I [Gallibacterium]MDA3977486.1 anthranilate synthase component I [Gallibacterium sp. AGMB14963]OBX05590.1 anthranilate synthase subunit I [Gallibacterium genomosp. 3]